MRTTLDHIVIACADLEQGTAWLRERLGVDPQPGGKHAAMGTHNTLLRLGPRHYLELLAIDPDAEAPPQARWFGLDERGIRERAAREPFLLTWVASYVLQLIFGVVDDGVVGYSLGSLISQVLLAPIGALAASILYFDLSGYVGSPAAQPAPSPAPVA